MNKVNSKNLIPLWVDHNNVYTSVPGYFIDRYTGDMYSSKTYGRRPKQKTSSFTNLIKMLSYSSRTVPYPTLNINDTTLFKDLSFNGKKTSLHKAVVISNIFHFDILVKVLQKTFPHIPKKVLEKTPRQIQEQLLRGLTVNHKDHNKLNHNYNNLELVTPQENAKKYIEHINKQNNIL